MDKLSGMQDSQATSDEKQEYYAKLPFPKDSHVPAPVGPNNPPWSSPIAVGVWIFSVLLIVFVPTIFLFPYIFSVSGGNIDQDTVTRIATSDSTGIFIQILAILPAHLLTLLVAWFVVTKNRTHSFTEMLGWRSGGMRWWHHIAIMIAFVSVMVVVGSIFPEQDNELLRMLRSSKLALYTIAILAVATAPLVEEVVYRGVLYSAFQRSVGTVGAVALVTFLFALVHVPQYYPSVSTILLLTLLSLILTLVRVYTGNLLPCIILHLIFNAFQSALLVAEPHLNVPPPGVGEQAIVLIGLK
jgi:membrane protease YdiL (CAAX protease family)